MLIRLHRITGRWSRPLQRWVWRQCVRWPSLANFYYCLSPAFRREHQAVIMGKLLHLEDVEATDDVGAEYTLRRNIHRLEKGLVMRPRRPVFATAYIGETVNCFAGLISSRESRSEPLICWSRDVLAKYFAIVSPDPRVDPHRERFHKVMENESPCNSQLVPYKRERSALAVDYQGILQLARRRRSVRWYLDKAVPREIIDQAIEVAKLSPSACNRQPFSFRVFDDKKLAQRIGAIPGGTAGFAENFPCLVVIVGDLRAYFSERDRHVIYVDAGLAAMAFQFALEAQGVGSCCINWPDIEKRERMMTDELGLSPNERPVMCLSLGFPDPTGLVPYSQKKSLDEMRVYNQLRDASSSV